MTSESTSLTYTRIQEWIISFDEGSEEGEFRSLILPPFLIPLSKEEGKKVKVPWVYSFLDCSLCLDSFSSFLCLCLFTLAFSQDSLKNNDCHEHEEKNRTSWSPSLFYERDKENVVKERKFEKLGRCSSCSRFFSSWSPNVRYWKKEVEMRLDCSSFTVMLPENPSLQGKLRRWTASLLRQTLTKKRTEGEGQLQTKLVFQWPLNLKETMKKNHFEGKVRATSFSLSRERSSLTDRGQDFPQRNEKRWV